MLAFLVSGTLPCDQVSEAIERKVQWDRGIYGGDPRPAGRRPFMPRKPIAPFARLARVAAWQWGGYQEGQAQRSSRYTGSRRRPLSGDWQVSTRSGRRVVSVGVHLAALAGEVVTGRHTEFKAVPAASFGQGSFALGCVPTSETGDAHCKLQLDH